MKFASMLPRGIIHGNQRCWQAIGLVTVAFVQRKLNCACRCEMLCEERTDTEHHPDELLKND